MDGWMDLLNQPTTIHSIHTQGWVRRWLDTNAQHSTHRHTHFPHGICLSSTCHHHAVWPAVDGRAGGREGRRQRRHAQTDVAVFFASLVIDTHMTRSTHHTTHLSPPRLAAPACVLFFGSVGWLVRLPQLGTRTLDVLLACPVV